MRYEDNAWRERAVYLNDAGVLEERLLDSVSPALLNLAKSLPDKSSEGYEIDLSSDVEIHINQLMEEDWHGLLLFFDYGKTGENSHKPCQMEVLAHTPIINKEATYSMLSVTVISL